MATRSMHIFSSHPRSSKQSSTGLAFATTPALVRAELECPQGLNHHAQYWWRSSGYALAVLLEKAGYSEQGQYRLLKFFSEIAPLLGPQLTSTGEPRWKSFMTDDHCPIEVSWDWRTGDSAPKIRFSIEPIGLQAGTVMDPENKFAASMLRQMMTRSLPKSNQEWLDHFHHEFRSDDEDDVNEDHRSTEFYAFDLEETEIVAKAYFFPAARSRATRRSNLDIISDAIQTAPGTTSSTPDKLQGLRMFQEYARDASTPSLEMDMLAVDLVQPSQQRFKIYFRIRETSFAAVREAMTLGGRITGPDMEKGLHRLKVLYHSLLGNGALDTSDDDDDEEELPSVAHRTAGILFNVEFRYGSKTPKVKAYLPVRHYARSDEDVISALNSYMRQYSTNSAVEKHVAGYSDAIRTLFTPETLSPWGGVHGRVHTYIGCSVEPGGEVRVVSYMNPRLVKFD